MYFLPFWLMSICSLISFDSVITLPCDSDFYLKLGNFIAFRPLKLILHLCPVTKGHFRDSVPSSWGVAHVWVSDLHFLVWSSLSTITAAAVGVHLCGEMQRRLLFASARSPDGDSPLPANHFQALLVSFIRQFIAASAAAAWTFLSVVAPPPVLPEWNCIIILFDPFTASSPGLPSTVRTSVVAFFY